MKKELKPNLFERQALANPKAALMFISVLVVMLSGFNIYIAVMGRTLATAVSSFQLALLAWILYTFRPEQDEQRRLMALRYVPRLQILIYALYFMYVIGFEHRMEVTPWYFLYIFLLLQIMPDRLGGILCALVILASGICFWLTGKAVILENMDYVIRFYLSASVFSALAYCSAMLRNAYLQQNEKATQHLKASEHSYRDLSDRLLDNIRERDEIEKKLHQAIKMETVGKMASGVAHDLNNILSGIVTYPDLVLLDLDKSHPMRQPLERIKKSGIKAAAIVEDLLTLSRRAVSICRVVDVKKILSDYLMSPEHTALLSQHKNIRLNTIYASDIKNISGSPIHLTKTIMNLICNALEAMPEGGRVRVELSGEKIEHKKTLFDKMPPGEYTVLKVTDSGIGIDEKDIEKIFEPFYTNKVMGRSGTGLGMAVVLGTVKDHKGFINVESSRGEGTCVTLYFPATDAKADSVAPQPETDLSNGSGEKILVIDDVPEQLNIACSILTRLGYRPESCPGGEDAIEKAKKNRYDLMIIDMVMAPGIDGLETYRQILDIHPGQKAVFATGFSTSEKMERAREMGAGPCLSKPYSMEKIGKVIKMELAR